jgi:PAS domain S-box-containing protein
MYQTPAGWKSGYDSDPAESCIPPSVAFVVKPPRSGSGPWRRHRKILRRSSAPYADLPAGTPGRERARQETDQARTILTTLVDEASVGIMYLNRDLTIAHVNGMCSEITGKEVSQLVGRKVSDAAPCLWNNVDSRIHAVLERGCRVDGIEIEHRRGGTVRHWLANVYPVHFAGSVTGVGVVLLDITDRKLLEQSGEQVTNAVVAALAAAAEVRDPYTAGHQRRVAELSTAIAKALRLDDYTVKGIGLAATIHDIGKLAIPSEILTRPGRLTPVEFQLIRYHSIAGHNIVQDIEFPWPVADMILQHHERLDGSGYPGGLRGDDICLGSKIIAVADVVEAMSAHRPYRPALGLVAALRTIEQGRGQEFDAEVVQACLDMLTEVSERRPLSALPNHSATHAEAAHNHTAANLTASRPR